MSDIEVAIGLARKIESALEARGARGAGLKLKAAGFAAYLPTELLRDISWVSAERNNVAHQDNGSLSDRARYERVCASILRSIEAIPPNAVFVDAEPWFHSNSGRRSFKPYSSPRPFAGSKKAFRTRRKSEGAAGMIVIGIFLALFGISRLISSPKEPPTHESTRPEPHFIAGAPKLPAPVVDPPVVRPPAKKKSPRAPEPERAQALWADQIGTASTTAPLPVQDSASAHAGGNSARADAAARALKEWDDDQIGKRASKPPTASRAGSPPEASGKPNLTRQDLESF